MWNTILTASGWVLFYCVILYWVRWIPSERAYFAGQDPEAWRPDAHPDDPALDVNDRPVRRMGRLGPRGPPHPSHRGEHPRASGQRRLHVGRSSRREIPSRLAAGPCVRFTRWETVLAPPRSVHVSTLGGLDDARGLARARWENGHVPHATGLAGTTLTALSVDDNQ